MIRFSTLRSTRPHAVVRAVSAATGAAALAILIAGCGGSVSPPPAAGGASGAPVEVVASTDVYGDIVHAIGGDRVHVTSIIHSPSQDPHSYEATSQDKLAVSKAGVLVENGGGYDDYFTKLTAGTGAGTDRLIDVADLSGLAPGSSAAPSSGARAEFNEHLWYNFEVMAALADKVAGTLGAADAGHSAEFTANAGRFKADLKTLQARVTDIKSHHNGEPVAVTEPVPLYLLDAAGLVNRTPEEFSHAIEAGNDVPVSVMKTTQDLISGHTVRLLAYNEQTAGPQTEALKKTADSAGVPVIGFTETLPAGHSYLQWMNENVDNLEKALQP